MSEHLLYERLLEKVSKLPVIDTHEHLWWDEASICKEDDDVLREYLTHYLKSDIISAGLSQSDLRLVLNHDLPIAQRWRIVEPYWNVSRYTGYGRALDISVKAIYGIDGVNRNTIEELNTAFLAAKKPGHYKHVLRDLCNIETSLLDVWTFRLEGESDLFKRIWQPANFISPSEPDGRKIVSDIYEKHNIKIKSLDDWLSAFELEMDDVLATYGVRVLKSAIAYSRTLRFEEVDYAQAKSLFSEAFAKWQAEKQQDGFLKFPRELQDYMMHYTLKLANERHLTFQFHTGLLEGNGNTLSNSDPSLLNNLFAKYPDVDFDLFHISYPYQHIASALAKMFPNVYVDMCWAHIISPSACVLALDDFLDAIPYNKISGFGGDYLFTDGIYGHLALSRENISRTLAGKVARGVFDEDQALVIAKALYYDNPKRIFKL